MRGRPDFALWALPAVFVALLVVGAASTGPHRASDVPHGGPSGADPAALASHLASQQPRISAARAAVFASPPSLADDMVTSGTAAAGASGGGIAVVSSAVHVGAVAPLVTAPSRAAHVVLPASHSGGGVDVGVAVELLVQERTVWTTTRDDVMVLEVGYEDTAFNLTLQLHHDPCVAVDAFCATLGVDALRCRYICQSTRDHVHMEATRRGLLAGPGPVVSGAPVVEASSLRDAVVAELRACVSLWNTDADGTTEPGPGTRRCMSIPDLAQSRLRVAEEGWYGLRVELEPQRPESPAAGELSRAAHLGELVTTSWSEVSFLARRECAQVVVIEGPTEGATYRVAGAGGSGPATVPLTLRLAAGVQPRDVDGTVCVDLLTGIPVLSAPRGPGRGPAPAPDVPPTRSRHCYSWSQLSWDDGRLSISLAALRVGRTRVTVSVARSGAVEPSLVCNASVSFEVAGGGVVDLRPSQHLPVAAGAGIDASDMEPGGSAELVVATAVSQRYLNEERLANMVGSLHVWEPNVRVVVYSLGLSEESMATLRTWRNVEVKQLPLDTLPPHVADFRGSYSFKSWIISRELELHHAVLWVDANMELRRPLDELRRIMAVSGHFATIQRLGFPNGMRHFPATVLGLGCHAPPSSRIQCWSAVLGVVRDSWFHAEVLKPMLDCSLRKDCISPRGSSRNNHRHDQSVMNAVLCRLEEEPCARGREWWPSSIDAEEEAHEAGGFMQPPLDAVAWNRVRLYNRREHAVKPYATHVRRRNY